MAIGNKLFALAEREYKQNRATPVRGHFKGYKLNISKYDEGWDRKRGAAVRMMGVILRDDDEQLYARVSSSDQTARTYQDAVRWFRREGEYLRRTATLLDTAADRLTAVIDRYEATTQPVTS